MSYNRGYSKGYSAGSSGRWPDHKPPLPPEQNVAMLCTALQNLINAVDAEISTFDPEDEMVLRLQPVLKDADSAFAAVTAWLKATPEGGV